MGADEVKRLTKQLKLWQRKLSDRQQLTTRNPVPEQFDFRRVKSQQNANGR
jgi:hypothetical protein